MEMHRLRSILSSGLLSRPLWKRYLWDILLSLGGSLAVTLIFYLFQLYPRIPNISLLYLVVVLALASTRGLFPAILASVMSFLSFDFFLVQPLYTFTIAQLEEWL